MKYPFTEDLIERDELIKWIAKTLYPEEYPRDSEKKVRSKIHYWEVTKKQLSSIRKGNTDYYEAGAFFSWAISTAKWQPLINVPGLPLKENSGTADLSLPGLEMEARAISTPQDLETAQRLYLEAETERYRLEKENNKLKIANADLLAEVNEFRERKAQTRKKRSAAGKRGKGVPRRTH